MKKSIKESNWFLIVFMVFLLCPLLMAQENYNTVGSFEQDLPSYWTKGTEPDGSTLTWATDEFMSMGRSLKIEKSSTSEAAMWESENMVDLWSDRHFANVDLKMGAYYKTMGVNTAPANDDQKWYFTYTFYKENGDVIGEWKKEIDQSVANKDWFADTTAVGDISLPEDAYKTIIRLVGGKDATGTIWFDNFIFTGRGGWAGQNWNTHVGVPTGWFYWLPPGGGNDGQLNAGYENTIITDETAYHGNYSLKFDMLEGTRDGFVGTRKYELDGIQPGDKIRVKFWMKGANLKPDSAIAAGDQWSVALTPLFHNNIGNNAGWGEVWASDMPIKFPNATEFDWRPFYKDMIVAENAQSITIRFHPLGRFQGTVWCDYLTVEKLEITETNEVGSFEQELPSYWTKGTEPDGSTLTWATDEFMSMGRSLKIEKSATSEAAMWESENMVDLWSDRHFANVDLKMGAYYKTMGVNTAPANDDQKWYFTYTFYKENGDVIGEWKKEIDQSVANKDWFADTTAVGDISLPEDAYKTIIRLVGGKDATGTIWFDNFIFTGRGGWAGQNWNTHVGVPTGWFYWLPPGGGNDGQLNAGYENTMITDEYAYHGNYSLKFDMLEGTRDGFVGTRKYLLNSGSAKNNDGPNDVTTINNVQVGDKLRIKVWIKGANLKPDSAIAAGDQWSVAITPLFHNNIGNNAGWGEVWASDLPLTFPNATEFDWRPFYKDITVVENAQSITVRIHPLGRFQGTVWCDYLTVEKLEITETNEVGSFEQELPSYWTKGTEPDGSTLTWATDEFMSMGRSLKIEKSATSEAAMWESENMVDLWSDRHFANVDLKMGAYYKTMGVNTAPSNDDQKWYFTYTFYKENGDVIGEWKKEIDQSVANKDWFADTTAVGDISLPEDAYKTIIRLVGGKDATGTIWFDNFIFTGRGGWAGQNWNTHVGVPTGWFYWLPPGGGNDGQLNAGYENTIITDEYAYHGNYSLKFDMLEGTRDGFVGTRKYLLNSGSAKNDNGSNDVTTINNVQAGDKLRISLWIKGANLHPDSVIAAGDQWSVAITPLFHDNIGNNAGWGEIWASDLPLTFPNATEFDWMPFYKDIEVVENAQSITVRIHPLGRFQGTVWCDYLQVKKIGGVTDVNDESTIPNKFSLHQNYPNPFNPSTTISYSIPQASYVTVKVYDMLGSLVSTLYSGEKAAGNYKLNWNGRNSSGINVSSGAYLYRIEAGDFSETRKMILLK